MFALSLPLGSSVACALQCRSSARADAVVAEPLEVVEVVATPAHGLSPAQAHRVWLAALRTREGLEVFEHEHDPEGPSHRLFARVEVLAANPPEAATVLRWTTSVVGPEHRWEDVIELERSPEAGAFDRELEALAERAAAIVAARLVLPREGAPAARRLLAEGPPEVVLVTLRWIAEHRRRELADDVVVVLEHHDDPEIVVTAVEVLGLVGGEHHVEALLARATLAQRVSARVLYEALGRIGGRRAERYLRFAGQNEDDPELARQAEQALAEATRVQPVASAMRPRRGHR